MIRLISMLALPVALTITMPAPAADSLSPGVRHDLQCLIVSAANGDRTKDENVKRGMGFAVAYYFGRIKVQAPRINLPEAYKAEAKAMDARKDIPAMIAGCGKEMAAAGAEFTNLGQTLKVAPR